MLPIFTETQRIGLGVDERLFAKFWENEYELWQDKRHTWQLRCFGGPGGGKTTLSALIVRRLKQRFSKEGADVAAIYFKRPIEEVEDTVLAVLSSVQRQLTVDNDAVSLRIVAPVHLSLSGVREALSERLRRGRRTFLIVDDLDLCSLEVTAAVEAELGTLQRQGVSIFVTSRVARQPILQGKYCDAVPSDDPHYNDPQVLYWVCSTCRAEGRQIADDEEERYVCNRHLVDYVCELCEECGSKSQMIEPNQYVDFELKVDEGEMCSFIAAELERNHGNLELGSSCHPKPLQSKLGKVLMESHTPYSAQRLLERITDYAQGNITITKLRLEDVEVAQNAEILLHKADRIPDNIIALYDAGIRNIQQKPEPYRTLALKALVLVAETEHAGMNEFQLQQQLRREAARVPPTSTFEPVDTLKVIIHAASGFLSRFPWDDTPRVKIYNEALMLYINENYNESLLWIRSGLKAGQWSRSSCNEFHLQNTPRRASLPKFRLQHRGSEVELINAPQVMNFKDDHKSRMMPTIRMAPKRQVSEPGRLKQEKQRNTTRLTPMRQISEPWRTMEEQEEDRERRQNNVRYLLRRTPSWY